MKLPHHLYQHPKGVWYFQLAIPRAVQPFFNATRVRYSLGTRDPTQAKIEAYRHTNHWLEQFRKMRTPTVEEILANQERLNEFKLGKAKGKWIVGEAKDEADYNLALREIGRLDSQGIVPEKPIAKIVKSEFVPKNKITLQEAVIKFLESIKENTIQKTFETKARILFEFKQFIKPNTLLYTVGKKELFNYRIYLLNVRKNTLRTGANKFIYVTQFFDVMRTSGYYLLDNPAENQLKYSKKQKNKDTQANKSLPFSHEEIKQIFLVERFSIVRSNHMYWGCLLGLLTGARVNEICQLLITDFNFKDNSIYFNITTEEQSLKSEYSRRIIPIHPILLELGIEEYVKEVEAHEKFQLFPRLKKTKNNFGDRLSKDFAKYLTKHKLKQPRKSFHSFRSTINNLMMINKVSSDFRSALLGQNPDNVNVEHYTEKLTPNALGEICFKDINLENIPIEVEKLKQARREYLINNVILII